MNHPEYQATKKRFVLLCVAFARTRALPERMANAPGEFDELVACGRFPRIAVDEGSLLATTHVVFMKAPDKTWRRIGAYVLEINRAGFWCFNQTPHSSGYHGPHIDAHGTVCISAGKEAIMGAIRSGRLAAALRLVEELVWHQNPDHSGQFMNAKTCMWPMAEKGKIPWLNKGSAPSSAAEPPAATSRGFLRGWRRRGS